MKIYLTRHGQTEWNAEGRLQGQLNSDLTDLGRTQAKWLGERMQNIKLDVIYSSTSGRAIETAEIINEYVGKEHIKLDDLREIYLGTWQGMKHEDIKIKDPEGYNALWNDPQAFNPTDQESFQELILRAGRSIETLVKKHKDQDILIVSHGMFLKAAICYFENKEIKEFWSGAYMQSTSLSLLEYKEGNFRFVFQGDVEHHK